MPLTKREAEALTADLVQEVGPVTQNYILPRQLWEDIRKVIEKYEES